MNLDMHFLFLSHPTCTSLMCPRGRVYAQASFSDFPDVFGKLTMSMSIEQCKEDEAEENPNVTLPGRAHGRLEPAKGRGCKSYSEGD